MRLSCSKYELMCCFRNALNTRRVGRSLIVAREDYRWDARLVGFTGEEKWDHQYVYRVQRANIGHDSREHRTTIPLLL